MEIVRRERIDLSRSDSGLDGRMLVLGEDYIHDYIITLILVVCRLIEEW